MESAITSNRYSRFFPRSKPWSQDPDHRDTADDEVAADDSLQPGASAKAEAAEEERQTISEYRHLRAQ